MGAIPNTLRRQGFYHFLRGIPQGLKSAFRKDQLCCSLQTRDQPVARLRSRLAYVRSEQLFALVKSSPLLTHSDIEALVKRFYESVLEFDAAARLASDEPLTDSVRQARIAHYEELAANSRRDVASNAFGSVRTITGALLAKQFGLDAEFDQDDRRKAMQALLRAGVDLSETLAARYRGDFNYEPRDKLLLAALAANLATAPVVADTEEKPFPASAQPEATAAVGPSFTTAAEEFRQRQLRRGRWDKQTANQAQATFRLFAEHAGDRSIARYSQADVRRFRDLLEGLPALWAKSGSYKGLTADEIVEKTRSQDLERLTPRTVQRHFAALSALWQDAIECGWTDKNLFTGWKFKAAKPARDQRRMWTSPQLQELFQTPIWRGCQSEHRRSKPGTLILRYEQFWLPLIAVFSGMRQEEICQLVVSDVRQEEGIWVFDVNATDGKSLKNASSRRLVPVHEQLIHLGFLRYVDEQRARGGSGVFPNLRRGGADERLGHNYSKAFTRYRQDVGLYAKELNFHSFRHSATTFLKRGGAVDSVVDELTGHTTPGETARYHKGLDVRQLQLAIDAIDIGVDLSWLAMPV